MALEATFTKLKLKFKFEAGTSRGTLTSHDTYLLKLWEANASNQVGIGEAGPLVGLSPDYQDIESELARLCQEVREFRLPGDIAGCYALVNQLVSTQIPSLRFAFESALLDLTNGGRQIYFPGAFTSGLTSIPINGLVWMGSYEFMKKQVDQKVREGYSCIKIKIGAIDFDLECALIGYIREVYGKKLTIRVDANGAFNSKEVFSRLERLSSYKVHSIEQPVKAGQHALMRELSELNLVPVALDEELIGSYHPEAKEALLESIRPRYIVLKPTLLGGTKATVEWINLARQKKIGWWITSALESNVGLNVLAQFSADFDPHLEQGLGTGQLYRNNTPTNLSIERGRLHYKP